MSQFNKYARELDTIAREAFDEYNKAAANLAAAEQRRREYPERTGGLTAEYVAASARAKADYLAAVQARDNARRKMDEGEYRQRIKAARKGLEASLSDAFRVNPEQIDANTLELLRSGVMTPDEYSALLNTAAKNGNVTMVRLIGKYADDAATAAIEKNGLGDPNARALRAVSYQSKDRSSGKQWTDAFDYMTDVYNRACRNPGMIEKWGELTENVVDKF